MKPIECPCCGSEMNYKGQLLLRYDISKEYVLTQHFVCGECQYSNAIVAPTEKAARKAWDKSLIGRVRKLINSPVYAGGTVMENSLVWWLRRMFGGDQ